MPKPKDIFSAEGLEAYYPTELSTVPPEQTMTLTSTVESLAFHQPGRLAIYILLLYILFLVVRCVYNVYFHPLSAFPGPKFAAASDIPYVHALVRGKLPHWVSALHLTYASPVVRISPTELSFISSKAWQDIYSHRPGHTLFEKDLKIYGKPPNGVHSLLTAPTGDHARIRRILDHAFSDKAYKEQQPIVVSYIDNLIKRLGEQSHDQTRGEVNLVKWYNWMTFDVIGDLSFGQSFKCLETQTNHPWVETIFGNLKAICLMGACNRFAIPRYVLPFLIPKRITHMINDHWAATTANVERRLSLGTGRSDFMSPIVEQNKGDKRKLEHEEIMSNASLFVIAGSESIATNLSGTTYQLLKNPAAMRRIKAEVDSTFTFEDEITPDTVSHLSYLIACLAETNRIYPTALTGQAMVVPPPGDDICGQRVPGGTGVTINQYAAYRSPTNFSDPDRFVPERWLDDPRYASDDKSVFQPFSVGPRNCIGKNLGNLETRLVLARMIWNFDMELNNETDPVWDDQKVYLSWQKKPLIVKLRPRIRSERGS